MGLLETFICGQTDDVTSDQSAIDFVARSATGFQRWAPTDIFRNYIAKS